MHKVKKIKIVLSMLTSLMLVLSIGCGRKNVEYVTDLSSGENINDQIEESGIDSTPVSLSEIQLLNEYKYNDEIDAGTTKHTIAAYVNNFVYKDPIYVSYKEKYYDSDDKKRVISYFADIESAEIDVDNYPSKEKLENDIEFYEEMLADKSVRSSYWDAAIINLEINRLKILNVNSLSKADIDTTFNPLSDSFDMDTYKASKNGLDYCFEFTSDEANNISEWTMKVSSYKDVLLGDLEPALISLGPADENNACTLTKGEAMDIAKNACKELNIETGESFDKFAWFAVEASWIYPDGTDEINGYCIMYDSTADVDMSNCYRQSDDPKEFETKYKNKPYPPLRILIVVNDSGIVYMSCSGMFEELNCSDVKLINDNVIKAVIRNELSQINELKEYKWTELLFHNIRVIISDEEYAIVPVWTLYNEDNTLAINFSAIDGQIIEPMDNFSQRIISGIKDQYILDTLRNNNMLSDEVDNYAFPINRQF